MKIKMKTTELLVKYIPHDKALHLIIGMLIYTFISLINQHVAILITFMFGIGKEIFDEWNYNGGDYKDMLFTVVTPLVLYILSYWEYQ